MKTNIDYKEARELLLNYVNRMTPERRKGGTLVDGRMRFIQTSAGRVLAEDIAASQDVPPFDRSPYDGYAFRAADTAGADEAHPVTLCVLEEIPAGAVGTLAVTPGTAVKILTGAPIPPGADAVVKYEHTRYTAETVTIFSAFAPGENVVPRGEDVKAGDLLAQKGTIVDPALTGVLAAQQITEPLVYKSPLVAVIATGSELVEPGEPLAPGKIVNTNLYILSEALHRAGCVPVSFAASVRDDPDEIAAALRLALDSGCDMVITTGGVSVGDYDYTPDAMERAGAEILVRTLFLKPGGASAYAVKDGRLICGLSGNPASAMINFYAVVLPAVRKLRGLAEPRLTEIPVTLAEDFPKKSPKTRLIRGRLDLSDGTARMHVSKGQGNGVLHSLSGCDLLAEIPAGSGPLPAGARLLAYLIP